MFRNGLKSMFGGNAGKFSVFAFPFQFQCFWGNGSGLAADCIKISIVKPHKLPDSAYENYYCRPIF